MHKKATALQPPSFMIPQTVPTSQVFSGAEALQGERRDIQLQACMTANSPSPATWKAEPIVLMNLPVVTDIFGPCDDPATAADRLVRFHRLLNAIIAMHIEVRHGTRKMNHCGICRAATSSGSYFCNSIPLLGLCYAYNQDPPYFYERFTTDQLNTIMNMCQIDPASRLLTYRSDLFPEFAALLAQKKSDLKKFIDYYFGEVHRPKMKHGVPVFPLRSNILVRPHNKMFLLLAAHLKPGDAMLVECAMQLGMTDLLLPVAETPEEAAPPSATASSVSASPGELSAVVQGIEAASHQHLAAQNLPGPTPQDPPAPHATPIGASSDEKQRENPASIRNAFTDGKEKPYDRSARRSSPFLNISFKTALSLQLNSRPIDPSEVIGTLRSWGEKCFQRINVWRHREMHWVTWGRDWVETAFSPRQRLLLIILLLSCIILVVNPTMIGTMYLPKEDRASTVPISVVIPPGPLALGITQDARGAAAIQVIDIATQQYTPLLPDDQSVIWNDFREAMPGPEDPHIVTFAFDPNTFAIAIAIRQGAMTEIWLADLTVEVGRLPLLARVRLLVADCGQCTTLAWNDIGSHLIYSSTGGLRAVGIARGEIIIITHVAKHFFPSCSHNGRFLTFQDPQGLMIQHSVHCIPIPTDAVPQLILANFVSSWAPLWSPDDNWLIFTSTQDTGRGQIYRLAMNHTTGQAVGRWSGPRPLYPTKLSCADPAWVGNGQQVGVQLLFICATKFGPTSVFHLILMGDPLGTPTVIEEISLSLASYHLEWIPPQRASGRPLSTLPDLRDGQSMR